MIGRSATGELQYTSPLISDIWGMGRHSLGSVTFKSAAYVARYVMKKHKGNAGKQEHYSWYDPTRNLTILRNPEYATMSRGNSETGGLGKSWILKYMDQTYPRDYIIINGKKARPPKYYDLVYQTVDPDGYLKLLKARALSGREHEDDQTPDRLEVREKIKQLQARRLIREL